jgi:hypothetical protein
VPSHRGLGPQCRAPCSTARRDCCGCTLFISITRVGFSRNIIAQVLLATGEVPDLPDDEDGGSLEILKPPPPAVEGGDGGADAKGKGKGDDKKKDKKKEKADEEGGEDGLKSAFVPNIRCTALHAKCIAFMYVQTNGLIIARHRSNVVRYCDFWEFKNEDDNFAQHVDVTMIQVTIGPQRASPVY